MFSDKVNLGRLETVTDRYFNDGEDVYTTIEKDVPTPTFPPVAPPTSVPVRSPTLPPSEKQIVNSTIVWTADDVYASDNASNGESDPEEENLTSPDEAVTNDGGDSGSDSDEPNFKPDPMPGFGGGGTGSGIGPGTEAGGGPWIKDVPGSSGHSPSAPPQNIVSEGEGVFQDSFTDGSKEKHNTGADTSGHSPAEDSSFSSEAKQETTTSKAQGKPSVFPNAGSLPSATLSDGGGMRRRETIQVKLIWGVASAGKKLNLWVTNGNDQDSSTSHGESTSINLADPSTQVWLLEVARMAKSNPQLFVRQDKLTWIERLEDFSSYAGVEFPIPEHLFSTYLQLLKNKDGDFATMIENAIGTTSPGLGGDYTFASITMMVDAVEVESAAQNISMSEQIYTEWTAFTAEINELAPPGVPDVTAQSSIFLDAYRVEATIDSTLVTWIVANGLCLLVILLFIQNISLSFMVMVTILLILFCLGGLLFSVYRVPFGPVEALGVSIFIGLSANYS